MECKLLVAGIRTKHAAGAPPAATGLSPKVTQSIDLHYNAAHDPVLEGARARSIVP
jgi:hypothetical protein